MTIDHWLYVALVIATLIAPSVPVLVGRLIRHLKPTREPSYPKTRIQRIGGWFMRRFLSPWQVPLLGILLSIYMLVTEFRITTPITRGAILRISLAVGAIIYNLVTVSVSSIWREIRQLWDSSLTQADASLAQAKAVKQVVDLVGGLNESMNKQADALAATMEVVIANPAIAKIESDKSPQGPPALTPPK